MGRKIRKTVGQKLDQVLTAIGLPPIPQAKEPSPEDINHAVAMDELEAEMARDEDERRHEIELDRELYDIGPSILDTRYQDAQREAAEDLGLTSHDDPSEADTIILSPAEHEALMVEASRLMAPTFAGSIPDTDNSTNVIANPQDTTPPKAEPGVEGGVGLSIDSSNTTLPGPAMDTRKVPDPMDETPVLVCPKCDGWGKVKLLNGGLGKCYACAHDGTVTRQAPAKGFFARHDLLANEEYLGRKTKARVLVKLQGYIKGQPKTGTRKVAPMVTMFVRQPSGVVAHVLAQALKPGDRVVTYSHLDDTALVEAEVIDVQNASPAF